MLTARNVGFIFIKSRERYISYKIGSYIPAVWEHLKLEHLSKTEMSKN